MDLIKTIEDDQEIQDMSEDSDAEVEVSFPHLPTYSKDLRNIPLKPVRN